MIMWPKQLLQAGGLVVFAIVAASCGAPIIAETTASSVGQPVEITLADAEAGPVQEIPESTVADKTTMTLPTLEYSLAWIEYQEIKSYVGDNSLEGRRIINNYLSSNPNDVSTPMGALCWALHELSRSFVMVIMRWILDDNWVPFLVEKYGISSEQIGSSGPEATEALLRPVSGEPGSVGSVDDGTGSQAVLPAENGNVGPVGSAGGADFADDGEFWNYLRLNHEFAGDGTAWSNAIRAVASPEMAAAFRAGEGLPPDVQVYADALATFAKERVGREFDPSADSDDLSFEYNSVPGFASFMGAAKYHQDCKRAGIADISSTVDSSSTSTTTISPVVSTTTTTQTAVEETSPATTGITAPPSVTTTQPLVDDAVPSSSSTTVAASVTTTQPQVENTSPSTTTVPGPPVDDSVTTTTSQSSVEEPVTTTLPQVEDTSPSATTTVPVPPVDDSVTTTTSLPSGESGPPPDDGGEGGLFDEDGDGE